jgi:phosphatidylserine decarboxylase
MHGKTVDELLYAMSATCQTPPKFENADIVGVPFYSMFIDLMATRFGQNFFANPVTNYHLKQIFNDYQKMLLSDASAKHLNEEPDGWFCPEAQKRANYEDYNLNRSKPHWGLKNWNDWFTRTLRPGARPVDPNPKGIVHSSDSYPVVYPEGSKGANPTFNAQGHNHFWLKDNCYSLHDMLGSRQQRIEDLVEQHFVGGTVYQAFLDPWCYHRWHAPISGTIVKSYKLDGTYYLSNP